MVGRANKGRTGMNNIATKAKEAASEGTKKIGRFIIGFMFVIDVIAYLGYFASGCPAAFWLQ